MIRVLLSLVLLLGFIGIANAEQDAIPVGKKSPAGMLRVAIKDLTLRTRIQDAPFTVYFSYHAVPESFREEFIQIWPFWFNHVSGARELIRFSSVPESDGLLTKINILSAPNWTRTAWAIVGNRDYLFNEFIVNHTDAENFRLLTGNKQDEKALGCAFIINAYQFFRDTMETARSQSGFDLLYAAERHPDDTREPVQINSLARPDLVAPKKPEVKIWKAGQRWHDGKVYDTDFEYVSKEEQVRYEKELAEFNKRVAENNIPRTLLPVPAVAKKGDAKFPQKGADLEKRWGAEVKADDLKNFLIDPRFGGIARGADSDADGSFVALNDRAIRIVKTRFGWSARTFDVFENTGDKDHLARFREVALGKANADGGEILFTLPNGAQTGALVNDKDDLVDIAASNLAQIRNKKAVVKGKIGDYPIDVHQYDKFSDVRNTMSCIVCHASHGGFIPFTEALNDSIKKGLQLKSIDENDAQKVRDFFSRWERELRSFQLPYQNYIQETTATNKNPKGLSPSATVDLFKRVRDWYDLPVGLDVVALEFGVDRKHLKAFLLNLNGDAFKGVKESVQTRINQLATEQLIPRRTYEVDVAREIGLLLSAAKTDEEEIKKIFASQLIEDAIRQLKEGKAKP